MPSAEGQVPASPAETGRVVDVEMEVEVEAGVADEDGEGFVAPDATAVAEVAPALRVVQETDAEMLDEADIEALALEDVDLLASGALVWTPELASTPTALLLPAPWSVPAVRR